MPGSQCEGVQLSVSSSMTVCIYVAGQSVAGILSDSEFDSTPQGKYNYVVFSTFYLLC